MSQTHVLFYFSTMVQGHTRINDWLESSFIALQHCIARFRHFCNTEVHPQGRKQVADL